MKSMPHWLPAEACSSWEVPVWTVCFVKVKPVLLAWRVNELAEGSWVKA